MIELRVEAKLLRPVAAAASALLKLKASKTTSRYELLAAEAALKTAVDAYEEAVGAARRDPP